MHSLTIWFGHGTTTAIRLLYKDATKAEEALRLAYPQEPEAVVNALFKDDYGQQFIVDTSRVSAAMLEDLDESKVGTIEYAIRNARIQAQANLRAQNDPVIKSAQLGGRGSVMPFDPMAGMRQ